MILQRHELPDVRTFEFGSVEHKEPLACIKDEFLLAVTRELLVAAQVACRHCNVLVVASNLDFGNEQHQTLGASRPSDEHARPLDCSSYCEVLTGKVSVLSRFLEEAEAVVVVLLGTFDHNEIPR